MWVPVLQAAEAWGVPPWEIAGGGSPLVWLNRYTFFHTQLYLKEQDDLDDLPGELQ